MTPRPPLRGHQLPGATAIRDGSRDALAIPNADGGSDDPSGDADANGDAVASTVLTVDELAALLRVNRKTVYDALSRGEIPGARRVGSTYRILRAAVIGWLASGQGRVSHSKRLR